ARSTPERRRSGARAWRLGRAELQEEERAESDGAHGQRRLLAPLGLHLVARLRIVATVFGGGGRRRRRLLRRRGRRGLSLRRRGYRGLFGRVTAARLATHLVRPPVDESARGE